jgi:mRNA-degrading endonuclease RelE of RelBE toxin-antitoxin system
MRYELILSPEALQDLRYLRANLRAEVRDALERHLRSQPAKASRSRIKRLRGLSRPQYRLRVGDVRVYYDIEGSQVHILAIVDKQDAAEWLRKAGR